MEWTDDQNAALAHVARWHADAIAGTGPQVCRIFGFAGTGKTTLAKHFAEHVAGDTTYAAFTGKAALMMRRNGCRGAKTIHSLIYAVDERTDGSTFFILNPDSDAASAALIVIDECSMVDGDLGRDLLSFGRPVLVIGDPAQLPPVKGGGFFTDATPDVMLTQIRRQALDNPIIWMANQVRQGKRLDRGTYGTSRVISRGTLTAEEAGSANQILVGRNVTRQGYNRRLRSAMGFEDYGHYPVSGDRLVCLRNDKQRRIFNGGLFTVTDADPHAGDGMVDMVLESEDFEGRGGIQVSCCREFFDGRAEQLTPGRLRGTQQFDFGYALTVHKAQGSQWNDVILYNESGTFREDWSRWLYTGITRAAERISIVEYEGSR